MSDAIRFWGTVRAVKPRLVLTKFGRDTTAKASGHLVAVEGTRGASDGTITYAAPGHRFTVALGPATQEKRSVAVGDLLRGEARPVPDDAPDVPADLYRVGVLRTIARAQTSPVPDPPRTDAPLSPEKAEAAPRRALNPANLAEGGPCEFCPYGTVVCVVRITDPRDYKRGSWSRVPACLGPNDCPHYTPL